MLQDLKKTLERQPDKISITISVQNYLQFLAKVYIAVLNKDTVTSTEILLFVVVIFYFYHD
jgi:hypothetical protein